MQHITILNKVGICSIVVLVYVNIEKVQEKYILKDTKLAYIFRGLPWVEVAGLDVALAASMSDW